MKPTEFFRLRRKSIDAPQALRKFEFPIVVRNWLGTQLLEVKSLQEAYLHTCMSGGMRRDYSPHTKWIEPEEAIRLVEEWAEEYPKSPPKEKKIKNLSPEEIERREAEAEAGLASSNDELTEEEKKACEDIIRRAFGG